MPVPSESSRIQYTGNGSSVTPYAVPFLFLSNGDIRAVLTDAAGVETLLTETTHYTLTGSGNPSGGSLVTVSAWDNTHTLTIYREPQQTQTASFNPTGALPADVITNALDKLTMIAQSLGRKVARCFRFNDKAGEVAALSEAGRASTVFGFDSGGNAVLRDSAALLSLLSLQGGLQGAPTAFWADSGERASKVPDFVGQLGLQLDNSTLWRSTGTTAGDWSQVTLGALSGNISDLSGTLALSQFADNIITAPKLAASATARIFGRKTGGAGAGEELTLSEVLDLIGSAAQGDVLYRGASGWERLGAGTSGFPLITKGAGQNPVFGYSSGQVVQKVWAQSNTAFSPTTAIPVDDTIPQNNEGDEIITLAVTPKLSASKIVVRFHCYADVAAALYVSGALFVDSVADAFAAVAMRVSASSGGTGILSVVGVYDSASVTAKTFKARVGPSSGTAYVNRESLGERFGTVSLITMEAEEIAP